METSKIDKSKNKVLIEKIISNALLD